MKKFFALSVVVILALSFFSACRAPHKCEAYSKVENKASRANS
ncbi:MAG: hypothetical protein ACHQRM_05045 [Bacteroidia bacterium]